MPLISVIIPTYQHGDTLAACLDSVFGQQFKTKHPSPYPLPVRGEGDKDDIEVIVVNDGSTDNTEDVLKPYLDRIIYKKIENSGAPKARNTGFALSKGGYVIFLDADIIMKQNMLQDLLTALKEHPDAAYAYGGFRFGIARFKGLPWSAERLRRINYIHTSALIRREAFIGFDESVKKLQDWDLWLSMLEKGKKGVAVNKILFSAKPRPDGMSHWLPKILYSSFFEALGIRFKPVVRYRHAADIIAKKHGLDSRLRGNDKEGEIDSSWLWLGFVAVFAISAISFGHPWLGTIASTIFLALTIAATLNHLIYGTGAILAELIFGSLAGKTLALTAFDVTVPLRIALFACVLIIWLIRLSQGRVRRPQTSVAIGVIVMLAMVGWGMVNGLLHGITLRDVFSDANAYFALPIILIFASAVKNENDQAFLKYILKHGVIALSVITIGALYFFSHKFWNPAGVFAYKWLRDSRIAEITALTGGFYRVFIQSHIFAVLAFIMVAFGTTQTKLKQYAWAILPAAALVISGSRSFALGLLVAFLVWVIINTVSQLRGRVVMKPMIKLVILLICGVALFVVALYFPLPSSRSQTSFQEMLRSRSVSERDAATVSRWALLKELDKKILEAPIQGSGFGTTVTYKSSDPRIVSQTGGSYTTAAFEWNYHDILIKMGIFGLLAYAYLLFAIFSILNRSELKTRVWILPAFFALLGINIVSPFLNHPLGIGYLALLLAFAETKKGEPITVAELIRSKAPASVAAAVPGLAMSTDNSPCPPLV